MMKKIVVLFIMLISMAGLTACVTVQDEIEKLHDDIAADNIQHVNISSNARSILIRQSENEYFEIYNGDLNTEHTYEVRCNENDDTLDINIIMDSAEYDNDILGSVIIDIPQKEFEKIEVTGDFRQVGLYTINSDVLIHANDTNDTFVYLDIEADNLEYNITLGGSESNTFRGVSVYLDKFTDNLRM